MLGIYDVSANRIHYYDSLQSPSDYTGATSKVFLQTTVKQLRQKRNLAQSKTNYVRHADSTYAKQSDGTSCGFFACYYVEAFLTLQRSSVFFMANPDFMHDYRQRVLTVLLSVSSWQFPEYVPLSGFTDYYSRTTTQRTQRQATFASTTRSTQAANSALAAVVHIQQCMTHRFTVPPYIIFSIHCSAEHASATTYAVFTTFVRQQRDRRVAQHQHAVPAVRHRTVSGNTDTSCEVHVPARNCLHVPAARRGRITATVTAESSRQEHGPRRGIETA